jgi:hypothetical protein
MKRLDIPRMNKKVLTISPLAERSDDAAYWHAATPHERLRAVETLRRLNYGHRQATARLQRVLEVVTLDGVRVNLISLAHLKANKKAAGRHKDLDDLENLP